MTKNKVKIPIFRLLLFSLGGSFLPLLALTRQGVALVKTEGMSLREALEAIFCLPHILPLTQKLKRSETIRLPN